jgi:C4-dicarboxylate-specific signal transduction histidine kinase
LVWFGLWASRRQRSLGELLASFGHELNQPLTAILTNAQVAKRRLQTSRFDTAPLNEFLDKIVFNTRRASHIIDRIRGFIRPSAAHTDPVNLHKIVRASSNWSPTKRAGAK